MTLLAKRFEVDHVRGYMLMRKIFDHVEDSATPQTTQIVKQENIEKMHSDSTKITLLQGISADFTTGTKL